MKKVLFVATVVKTHIMEFHIPYLKMFKEMGWETAVAARNDYENPADCVIPYCDILMLLYNEDNHATEYARKIADKKGLKLVKISWEMKKPPMVDKLFTHRSPADFLSLFANADFVVTNSFHGLAFSINFERQFVVVPRNEFNSRIDSLLMLCGLSNRLVQTEEAALMESNRVVSYNQVNRILSEERKRANQFIIDAIQ